MSIQDASGEDKGKKRMTGKDIKKWFDTCFEQIYKHATMFVQITQDDNISLDDS